MTRGTLMLAGSALALACGSDIADPTLPPPPSPTIGLFGILETERGLPIGGARVDLLWPPPNFLQYMASTETSDSGVFAFPGVDGPLLLRTWKLGYASRSMTVTVTDSTFVRLQLALWRLPAAGELILGEWFGDAVREDAPPCDPDGWEREAHCRRLEFVAPVSGNLEVYLAWVGEPQLDLALVSDIGYIAWSEQPSRDRTWLEGPVVKGQRYEVWVHASYGSQDFQLKAVVVP